MIASLTGTIKSVRTGNVVIEVGGVGLLVHVSPRTAVGFKVGSVTSLQTVLVVREDALTLYGFETQAAREIFELLQTVTGIGPKVAQSALNIYETTEIVNAIRSERTEVLERIPGLGKKGAQRLVLELREKLESFEVDKITSADNWRDQITSALIGLGFTAREAQIRIDQLSAQFTDAAEVPIADLLRAALAGGVQR